MRPLNFLMLVGFTGIVFAIGVSAGYQLRIDDVRRDALSGSDKVAPADSASAATEGTDPPQEELVWWALDPEHHQCIQPRQEPGEAVGMLRDLGIKANFQDVTLDSSRYGLPVAETVVWTQGGQRYWIRYFQGRSRCLVGLNSGWTFAP